MHERDDVERRAYSEPHGSRRRGGRRRGLLLTAFISGVVATAVGVVLTAGTGTDIDAACPPPYAEYDRDYYIGTSVLRVPQLGRPVGTAVNTYCDDGHGADPPYEFGAFAVPGVDPSVAFQDDAGQVYVARDQPTGAIAELRQPVPCTSRLRVSGTFDDRLGPVVLAGDRGLTVPYRAEVLVSGDQVPGGESYRTVLLTAKVDAATIGGTDDDAVRAAQSEQGTLLTLTCRGSGYRLAAIGS